LLGKPSAHGKDVGGVTARTGSFIFVRQGSGLARATPLPLEKGFQCWGDYRNGVGGPTRAPASIFGGDTDRESYESRPRLVEGGPR